MQWLQRHLGVKYCASPGVWRDEVSSYKYNSFETDFDMD